MNDGPGREQKHVLISRELDTLESAVNSLRDLKEKISGANILKSTDGNKAQEEYTLVSILDSLPGIMKTRADHIKDLVAEIQTMLF